MSSLSSPPVIFYAYDASPFAQKIAYILTIKNIPHQRVDVSSTLPRPEISSLLGIAYRRIPLLAIGNDVYCDTSLISSALERRFPASAGYGTIFPPNKSGKTDTGMIKAFAQNYPEKSVFPLAAGLLPWNKFPEGFLKDRSDYRGGTINVKAMEERRPQVMSYVSSHLALLEEQLSDDREWLFDTALPGLADVSVYFIYAWIQWNKDLFAPYPKSLEWISRLTQYLKQKKSEGSGPTKKITGDEAAKIIVGSVYEPYDTVGFDNAQAKLLGLQPGQTVALVPDDTGKNHPTVGKLVGLNKEEFVIETKSSSGSVVRCHLPRLGFIVKRVSDTEAKL